MIQALIGQKSEQTQKFLENGRRIPVTKIAMSDNAVLQVKTAQKEQYAAVQLGFGGKRKADKALVGHVKKAGVSANPQFIKEVALTEVSEDEMPKVGDKISLETVFRPGDVVDVTGTSKGKGFAGVVKRHNFRGGPKTHGQSDRHRAPGSIGQTTTPGRVYRGKRMAGRMGSDTVTVANLTVVDVDVENKTLLVCGLVPGNLNGFLIVTKKGEDKKFVPLLETVQREEAKAAAEAAKAEEEAKNQTVAEEATVEAQTAPESVEEVQAEEAPKAEENVETKEEKEDGK